MPLIFIAIALLFVLAFTALILPLSIIQRYRAGTARRPGRRWVATINVYGIVFSALLFLGISAVTNLWVPQAFLHALGGMAAGGVLGIVGVKLTRWEITPRSLHYTPNRWLVLGITLVVTARIAYGFWRGWQAWSAAPDTTSWLVASGAAGSIAAGAVVIGYYLAYWAGVRRRITTHAELTRT